MGETEYTRLILAPNREITPKTRLACCVRVEDWMNGMIISLVDTSDPYQMEDLPDKTGTGHLRDKTI